MLKHNKHRIIPVILEKITDVEDVDKNLLYILGSIPCLKWPGEGKEKKEKVFWEKLRLFMPKRRENARQEEAADNGQDENNKMNGLVEYCLENTVFKA